MPRFDLKALLYSTALISLGLGVIATLAAHEKTMSSWHPVFGMLLVFSIGPTIGAGVLLPFRRAWMGFALGLLVQVLLVLAMLFVFRNDARLAGWIVVALLGILATIMLIFTLRQPRK
jgi:hypothetical protein